MARTRNIKPGFFQNEELAALDPLARILFSGLWCWSDRDGLLEDRPKRLKALILPFEERCNIDKLLDQLAQSPERFIIRYSVNGRKYIAIKEFSKHQNPHCKEQKSIIPAPESTVLTPCLSGASDLPGARTGLVPENPVVAGPCMGNGVLGMGNGVLGSCTPIVPLKGTGVYVECFSEWWNEYPKQRRANKATAYRRYKAAGKALVARGMNRQEAIDFLLAKVQEFSQSPLGQTKYAPAADVWLNKGRYDDAPEAWQLGDDKPDDPDARLSAALKELDEEFKNQ